MSERERWIIYPLLFLAISAALKDKLVKPSIIKVHRLEAQQIDAKLVSSAVIRTNGISVEDSNQRPKIVMQAVIPKAGDTDGIKRAQGQINVLGADGQNLVAMGGGDIGGYLIVTAQGEQTAHVVLGHHALGTGLFWLDDKGRVNQVFAVKPKPQPATPAPPENGAANTEKPEKQNDPDSDDSTDPE